MIFIEGYRIASFHTPPDPAFGTGGIVINRWNNATVAALSAIDGAYASLQFQGNEQEEDVAALQGILDSTVAPAYDFLIHFACRETGSGVSWQTFGPQVALVDSNGQVKHSPGTLWGSDTGRTITGTWKQFAIPVTTLAEAVDDPFAANSIIFWAYYAMYSGTKQLQFDEIVVEPLTGA